MVAKSSRKFIARAQGQSAKSRNVKANNKQLTRSNSEAIVQRSLYYQVSNDDKQGKKQTWLSTCWGSRLCFVCELVWWMELKFAAIVERPMTKAAQDESSRLIEAKQELMRRAKRFGKLCSEHWQKTLNNQCCSWNTQKHWMLLVLDAALNIPESIENCLTNVNKTLNENILRTAPKFNCNCFSNIASISRPSQQIIKWSI